VFDELFNHQEVWDDDDQGCQDDADERVHSHSAHGMLALPARLFRNFHSEVSRALF
jgi:hypothetical protein